MTDLDTLGKLAEESVEIQTPADPPELSPVTEQGGYVEITGDHHDRYYVIPASISTRSEIWYSLILFYQQPSTGALLLRQLPPYCAIWILAFLCIFFVSRFLLHRAFEPTERVLHVLFLFCIFFFAFSAHSSLFSFFFLYNEKPGAVCTAPVS